MNTPIHLDNLMSALSLSLDLAENRKLEHARRTAYMAIRIAEILKLNKNEISDIYYGALLHDIGKPGLSLENIIQHPEIGANIIGQIPYLEDIKPIILQHHEHWNGTGPINLQGNEITIGARIIRIADDIEYHFSNDYSIITVAELENFLENKKDKAYDPFITSATKSLINEKDFLSSLSLPKIEGELQNKKPTYSKKICYNDLEIIGGIFATLIDSKSPFTATHSSGVAEISEKLAQKAGLSNNVSQKLKISGLLHDLGKMAIPNNILDKPGRLTTDEYKIIQSHTYYTELILNELPAIQDIKEWSAMHHEKLDGSGYHKSIPGQSIPIEGRIIAIADIYHALTADRPYRKGMDNEKAFSIIQDECEKGKLDYDLFHLLKEIA